jgi:hypothetical protein
MRSPLSVEETSSIALAAGGFPAALIPICENVVDVIIRKMITMVVVSFFIDSSIWFLVNQ